MKLNFLFIGLILLSFNAFSQESEAEKNMYFSLYSNFQWNQGNLAVRPGFRGMVFNGGSKHGNLSLGFGKQVSEHWVGELFIQNINFCSVEDKIVTEIDIFGAPQVIENSRTLTSGLDVGMVMWRKINSIAQKKMNFSLGTAFQIGYDHTDIQPRFSDEFPLIFTQFMSRLSILPRVSYQVNDKLSLESSAFLYVLDLGATRVTEINPRIPVNQRRSLISNTGFGTQFNHVRIGLSYKL